MTNTTDSIHPFEQRGLGLAPFRFLGMIRQDIAYGEAVIGGRDGFLVTTKPGGTCDYCGAYIRHMYEVGSADGRTFKVGSDCAGKIGGKVASAVKRAEAARRKQATADALTKLRAELAAALESPDLDPDSDAASYGRFCLRAAGARGVKAALARLRK